MPMLEWCKSRHNLPSTSVNDSNNINFPEINNVKQKKMCNINLSDLEKSLLDGPKSERQGRKNSLITK